MFNRLPEKMLLLAYGSLLGYVAATVYCEGAGLVEGCIVVFFFAAIVGIPTAFMVHALGMRVPEINRRYPLDKLEDAGKSIFDEYSG